tara:strand:- start:8331 stop:8531 length:201 start_codon:yes stop_codon:yes gene_type:complete
MAMRPYPKGTGAGISLFILIALGIYAVSQVEEMKRTAFRDGFRCAADGIKIVNSTYNCEEYKKSIR